MYITQILPAALLIYLILINIITFFVYGLDKRRARLNQWRIPEKTLILLAAIGGSVGAYAGMQVWHHKTKHVKFYLGVPAIFIVQAGLVMYLIHYMK